MPIEQATGAISVELSITRYQVFREDGCVQVWGHVGDYEVSVWLPLTDPRVQRFVRPKPPRVRKAKPSSDGS